MNNNQLADLKKWIESIDKKLDNHLVHVAKDISRMQNDLDWVKRFFFLVTSTSITAILAAVIGLILK